MPGSSSHARTPFRRAGRVLAAIAWAGLIFAASSRPDLRVSDDDLLDLVLRKAAHLFVFGVLAVLVARVLRGEGLGSRATLGWAWLVTLGYAISDEWHQTFVEGRAGQASDVAIDMVGATVGLVVLHRAWSMSTPRKEAIE
jgi:VanZ family protein